MEINKKIEHYTQQRYLITYVNKDKRKLQISAVTPKKIQLLTWKKTRVESPTNLSYHYTPRSTINITSTGVATSNMTSAFGRFSFQMHILKDLTHNHQCHQNSDHHYLPQISEFLILIVINQPLINSIAKLIQPPLQLSSQQFVQQQPLQLPPQQFNLDPIIYAPITKLDNFTSEENNTQIWLNNIEKNDGRALQTISYFLKNTADSWYQSLATKPQTFNEFKTEFLRYFSNNNSINCLTNTFTTIKQEDTEATIQADYFTASQILNQFIRGLCSSILQQVCPMHPVDLPTTVTHVRDFEAAELKANHAQAVNLVINGSSDLDSKLKQFSNTINQKLEGYLTDNCAIYQPPQ
ncbi:hypothetical protein G9A89_009706 [Geosiphon pyriformis]|nr:hypothetical protein G9A89_009706 [Geosiphon pyriformis]